MAAVYGAVDDGVVRLLDAVQERYSGLTYNSGFFDSTVIFSPVCEIESSDDEIEISYAVDTGGAAGAFLTRDGEVNIGLDNVGVVEFPNLDYLIECDSMFATCEQLPFSGTIHLHEVTDADSLDRVRRDIATELTPVPEATGSHSGWFHAHDVAVFYCTLWFQLGLAMPAFLRYWARGEDEGMLVERLAARA
jgi:hypothetical protein